MKLRNQLQTINCLKIPIKVMAEIITIPQIVNAEKVIKIGKNRGQFKGCKGGTTDGSSYPNEGYGRNRSDPKINPIGATNEGQISGLELKECPIDSYLHNIMKCTYRDSDSC